MNSSRQKPPSISSSHRNDGSSNSHLLQKDVSCHDHQVALELERLHELRHQVAAQEQKLQSLRQQAANSEGSHSLFAAEQGVMKSLIFTKEKELALALMKVAELTSQLEQLRRGHVDDVANKSSQKRIEGTGLLATCEAEQHLKRSHPKAIPIKVIKESVHLNNDVRKNSTTQSAEEKQKSDQEKGVRYIPIIVEKKAVGIPSAAVAEGHGTQGAIKVSCNKTVLGQNLNASVQNTRDVCHNTNLSSKKSFLTDFMSSSVTNNMSSDKGAEIVVKHLTADSKDIKTDTKSEKRAESDVYSESSNGNVLDDKNVENEKVIPSQYSEFRLAESLACDKNIQDTQSSFAISKDNNWAENVYSNSSGEKPANVMNNSSSDKKESGLSQTADKQDVCSTKNVCDKMNESCSGNFSSERTDGSTLKTFSQSRKSFSDFSLSTQLGQPIRESFSSTNQTGQKASPWDSGVSLTKQHQPLVNVGNLTMKPDRARFFMDMVREDDSGAGCGQPLVDSVRSRGFVEVKPSATSTGSSTTSRGRSSSSAIMSRFAPQPYGRSKSVDSGSLRVPMTTVHGASRREQSPEVMGIDSKTVSSSTITPSSEPNPPLCSSPTVLQLQTASALPLQATVTKASEDRRQITVVHGMRVPLKEATISETVARTSQLSSAPGKPLYTVQSIPPTLSFSRQKIANAASLDKYVPDLKLSLAKTAAPEKTTGDSKSSTTNTVTVGVTGTALAQIDHSVMKLGQTESSVTSVINTTTDSKFPTTSSHLMTTVTTVCGVVASGSVSQDATTAKMVTLGTSVCAPTELEFSKSKVTAGSDITAVFSGNKSIASAKVSPSVPSNAIMPSDAKILPISSVPVSDRVLQGNSLASEPTAEGFRTVSVVMKSASPLATAFANSESTSVHATTGTVPTVQPPVSKAEDLQSAEEMADTPWDSNVKRLAHIYAVTIGGTVKNKGNLHSSRHKVSDYAAGASSCAQVAPLTHVSKHFVPAMSANRTEHSKHETYLREIADGKSFAVSSAKDSSSFGCLDTSSLSDSRGAVSPSMQHSHSTNGLPWQPSPDVTQVSPSKRDVLEQSKIDTSVDSVNTALSVLLQNNSSGHSSPVRPSRLRTTISSAYRRKLGSGALDNYSQNMTLLYGDSIANKDNLTSVEDIQDSSTESVVSPPALETPLIEDLPRILALDTLDGMPFYPRIGSHLINRDSQISSEGMISDRKKDQLNHCNECLKTGDVEMTVIANPVQTADLIRLDSAETAGPSTLASFSPSDALVPSYIDDPVASDQDRFIYETPARPSRRRLFRKDGKPQRRVTFDAVSLLLNAALEGEKDLLIEVVNKIANPNHKTENGLSALHNAVCGGHVDIARYLVEFGCDVNATDNDGWTPLHCAASSNNVEMMQVLVEGGAGILPLTISDRETPVQKCSRNLPGYEEAVRYLTDVARNLGVENDGRVYVTSNFANVCSDELVLHDGGCLKVLRKGDESETEWWWARDEKNAEGYIPQSLLARFPRISPKWLQ